VLPIARRQRTRVEMMSSVVDGLDTKIDSEVETIIAVVKTVRVAGNVEKSLERKEVT
jgi:hypothetical protein